MLFKVKNYTRYNTEDLTGILRTIEAAIRSMLGWEPERAPVVSYQPDGTTVSEVIAFKDYTTKKVSRREDKWDIETSPNFVRVYVKQTPFWRRCAENDIRIIPPRRLWTSPLEQLAATRDGDLHLPPEARAQIIHRLLTFFKSTAHAPLRDMEFMVARVLAEAPQIRIMAKRAETIPTEEKHRVARHRAYRTWVRAQCEVDKLLHHGNSLNRRSKSALGTLRRSKVPLLGLETDVDETVEALLQAVANCQTALSNLRASQDPDDT